MVIQHNVPAINALRQKTINNTNATNNLEKLSSGYRVNRAGDDAAGLGISEKMRGQIKGLSMATQNAKDGISLIQTAEGGLHEVHDILHRMRELGVQASNGTYQQDDRRQIGKEVEALKSEIDRIAGATHFNGINLLDGTLGGYTASSAPGTKGPFDALGAGDYYTGSYAALAAQFEKMGFAVKLDNSTPANVTGSISITTYSDSIGGEKAKLLITSATECMDPNGQNARVTMQIGDKTYVGKLAGGSESLVDADGEAVSPNVSADTYIFLDNEGRLVATLENNAGTGGTYVGNDTFVGAVFASGVITGIPLAAKDDSANNPMVLLSATSPAGNLMIVPPNPLSGIMVGTDTSKLEFQIGANGHADQRVGLHVGNMSSANLGTKIATAYNTSGTIAGIDVSSIEAANDALIILDTAIMQVSETRANLGSLQNRLEHSIGNLGVTMENLTAAESSIRDVDMAKEMMDFQKNNILNEASQSMLAQANQLPQGILSLLR